MQPENIELTYVAFGADTSPTLVSAVQPENIEVASFALLKSSHDGTSVRDVHPENIEFIFAPSAITTSPTSVSEVQSRNILSTLTAFGATIRGETSSDVHPLNK